MGSSYYITYGGNRLTFPGATGSVAWENVPSYRETLLWSGVFNSGSITLSGHPSAYDVLRIVPGGYSYGNNSLLYNPLEVSWKQLSSTNNIVLENAMFGETATSGVPVGWWFGGKITGCSGTNWNYNYGYGRRWNNNTSRETRYDFTFVRQIWGVNYG